MKYFYLFIIVFCLISSFDDNGLTYSSVYYERIDNQIVVKKDGRVLFNHLPKQTKIRSNDRVFFTIIDTIVYFKDFKKKYFNCIGVNRILENKHNDSILILQKYNNEILRINLKTGDYINSTNTSDTFLSLDFENLKKEYDDLNEEFEFLNLVLHTNDSIFTIDKFYSTEKYNLDTINSYHFYQDFSFYDEETNSFIYWFYLRDKRGGEIRLYDLDVISRKTKLIFTSRDLFFIGNLKFKKLNNSYYLSNRDSVFLIKNNKLHFLLNFKNYNLDWYYSW
jgi:hypothetical protein